MSFLIRSAPYLGLVAPLLMGACMAPTPVSDTPATASGNEKNAHSGFAPVPAEGEPAALLEGPMGKLDGAPFRGTEAQIRVPVGCHVLETNRGMVVATSNVQVRVQAFPVTFAIVFHPDHRYVIERTAMSSELTGASGSVMLRTQVHEHDANDAIIQLHGPAELEAARRYCDSIAMRDSSG